jgi:hypothetical protein
MMSPSAFVAFAVMSASRVAGFIERPDQRFPHWPAVDVAVHDPRERAHLHVPGEEIAEHPSPFL